MKFVIMHGRRGSARHFTLDGPRLAALMSGALLLAALAGALIYRSLAPGAVPAGALTGTASQDPRDAYTDDAVHHALAMLAEKVGMLQARLAGVDALSRRLAIAAGVPQPANGVAPAPAPAHAPANGVGPAATRAPANGAAPADAPANMAMDGARANVAEPGGAGNIAAARSADMSMDGPDEAGSAESDPLGPAQALGRDIDLLTDELAARMAALQVFDMALTRRRADLARLPSSLPVTDYPYLSSSYGWRRHPVSGRYLRHEGLDFAAPHGTPILAAAGGVVLAAGPDAGYGRRVDVDHGDGLVSRYAHASEVLVQAGDLVERGQLIARVGSSGVSTGPHLHFEIRLAGQAMDPRLFLGRPPTAPPALAAAATPVLR